MKSLLTLFGSVVAVAAIAGCDPGSGEDPRDDSDLDEQDEQDQDQVAPGDDVPPSAAEGRVIFYTDLYGALYGAREMQFTINGRTRAWSNEVDYRRNPPPTCGGRGYNLNLPIGAHSYSVQTRDGKVRWSGSVNVSRGGCVVEFLKAPTGKISFWYSGRNPPVQITVNGEYAGTVDQIIERPTCGSSNPKLLTLTLEHGEQTVIARDARGDTYVSGQPATPAHVYPNRCELLGMGPFQ